MHDTFNSQYKTALALQPTGFEAGPVERVYIIPLISGALVCGSALSCSLLPFRRKVLGSDLELIFRTNTKSKGTLMNEFLSIKEAATALDVAQVTVRRMVAKGSLSAVRVGRLVKVHASAIEVMRRVLASDQTIGRARYRWDASDAQRAGWFAEWYRPGSDSIAGHSELAASAVDLEGLAESDAGLVRRILARAFPAATVEVADGVR